MVKLLCFDLDGVLCDSADIHYRAFNEALAELKYPQITPEEQKEIYNGLPTKKKLEMLKIPEKDHERIFNRKQELTAQNLSYIQPNNELINALGLLRELNKVKLAVCTNAIRPTTELILRKLQIYDYFHLILTNEDVDNKNKPDPTIYTKAIEHFKVRPEECLVLEDSKHGINSAVSAGATIFHVKDLKNVTYSNIINMMGIYS